MSEFLDQITPELAKFIRAQPVFFVATAAPGSRINLSPKGMDTFRVLDEKRVAYLDLTGSGNETAAHLRASGRLTIMFCAFENVPMILRLYGQGRSLWRGTAEYAALLETAYGNEEPPGARQIVCLDIEMVQTSCGYGVPLFDYKEDRPTLRRGAENQGVDGVAAYWREKNVRSIDGFETGVAANDPASHGELSAGADEDRAAISSPVHGDVAGSDAEAAIPVGLDHRDAERLATAG